ncbi:MAG: toll/interleukin-1 receptor domain-containing protein [Pseudomonadota bacterium]
MDARFREDLDHFLTLFIWRPGWGNYETDQPLLTLWELALETANRDVEVDEEAMRLHVWGVLERADHQRLPVEEKSWEIVREFMRVYGALRHLRRGLRYLPHCRTLDVHPACSPASDPKWQVPPTREIWEAGRVVTYACYPGGISPWKDRHRFPTPEINDFLHRLDGPALQSYFDAEEDRPEDTCWCRHGLLHRVGGPALTFRSIDGRVRRESWYVDGLLHREDGPAEIWYPAHFQQAGLTGPADKYVYGWHLDGREMPFTDYLTRVTSAVRAALTAHKDHFENAGSYLEDRRRRYGMSRSVFISYGGPDESAARVINDRLKQNGFSTWFFPDDALPGEKLHRVMSNGVHQHDRVLLLCSRSSLTRLGVQNELEQVLEREAAEGGTSILIPVRLDNYVLSEWAPERPDLARQVRSRVIADFSSILDEPLTFDREFPKLVRALLGAR